jgi:hypothetical protein
MPGYKPFESTAAAVAAITAEVCKTVGTVTESSLHGHWHTPAQGRYMSETLWPLTAYGDDRTALCDKGYMGSELSQQEVEVVDFTDHSREAYEIKCEMADDILVRLVREAYAECTAVLGRQRRRQQQQQQQQRRQRQQQEQQQEEQQPDPEA